MKRKRIRIAAAVFVTILFVSVSLAATCIADSLKSPWEAPKGGYILKLKNNTGVKDKGEVKYETNVAKLPFLWGLKFWQNVISPIDGDKCGMYPTCSGYSTRAFKKHGALLGIMMTADRLIHEADEMGRVPIVKKYGVRRFYDPINNNDFWFAKERDPS